MVSSVCRGSYPSMTPHASPLRKPHVDPQKDYTVPLQVETSVEYDLPAHIYPPKDSKPILMIHPGYVSAVRARSRAVITPSPTAMVATSGAARPLAPLQLPQQHLGSTVRSSSSRSIGHQSSWCTCGNPNCNNSSSVKSFNIQSASIVQQHNVQNASASSSSSAHARSVHSLKSVVQNQNMSVQSARDHVNIMGISATRNGTVLIQQQQQQQQQSQQQMVWGGNGGRCIGPCCNPRAGAMAPLQAEFVAPGLPPSLLARTPTRGTAGGSPKLRAARTRRGLSVASSVNLPDYLGTSRPARVTGAVHAHPRPRALSTSMGALAATPAPPMAHQQHAVMGASLTTSLDLARAHPLTPRSLLPGQQQLQQAVTGSTASFFYTVGLSRDSGCSVGAETAGGEWASDRTRGLVDSGFCTPVDLTDDFVADTLSLGASWNEPSNPISSSMTSSSIISNSSSSGGMHHTSSLLPGTAHSHNHYLPQPLWNLAY